MPRILASAGPATTAFEALASTIGAGLVVGGFIGGLASFLSGRSRPRSEKAAFGSSYAGGVLGLLLLAIDILEKRFV
jgi:hypothetical protein